MPKSLNRAALIGHLGRDPELKYTQSGIAFCMFTLATNESWKDADGNQQERVEWHNIVAWRKLAEICGEWLKKGKRVYIEGKIQTSRKEIDGVTKYFTSIVADNMIMLDGGGRTGAEEGPGSPVAVPADRQLNQNDDLPF